MPENEDWGFTPSNESTDQRNNQTDNWGSGNSSENQVRFGSKGRTRNDFNQPAIDEDGNERPPPFRPEEVDVEAEREFSKNDQGINFDRFDRIEVDVKGASIQPVDNFSDLITSDLLLNNIKMAGYKKMTPIQRYTIPAMAQGHDLVGCAQTGSGKTAAFLLPVLQTILNVPNLESRYGEETQMPYCIVIAPTRELIRQTYVECLKLAKDSIIQCACIYGGVQTGFLRAQISKGCHILLATPGRLKDFIERRWIGLDNIKYVILDEGDRLIDDGFVVDMRVLFGNANMPGKSQRQTMFFSATFKPEARMVAKEFMKEDFIFITVGMVGAANEDVKQEFIFIERSEKKRELKKILLGMSQDDRVIVFTQTKATADVISGFLSSSGIDCTSIHGDRHQFQREQALSEFKRGRRRCLVASPVGERGLDLPKVSMVVNYDMPNTIDEYIHRIGRTGRIGNTGRAISFFDPERDANLSNDLKNILQQAQQEIPDYFNGGSGSTQISYNNDAGFCQTSGFDSGAPVGQEEEAW